MYGRKLEYWEPCPEVTDDQHQVTNHDSVLIPIQPLMKVDILGVIFSARKAQKENVIYNPPEKPLPGSIITFLYVLLTVAMVTSI